MDAIDEAFDGPATAPVVAPKFKPMPRQLLYFCATGQHARCGLYGRVNGDEGKTNGNAGPSFKVRCSCPCHHDQFGE